MNTLDEVIIGIREQMGFGDPILVDALHYLKELKEARNIIATAREEAKKQIEDFKADVEYRMAYNPALTWDELRQMEGKPVWVEYNFQISNKEFRDNSKRWCIIREFKPWHDTEIIITDNGFVLSKKEQIKSWQAYRKERG